MVFEESVVLDMAFDDALERVKVEMGAAGFGVLTEIDMAKTLHAKVGKEMDRYVILGTCNPGLASQALDAEPLIGVLLPCNVVVREAGGRVEVDAMDPGLMGTMTQNPELQPLADTARELVNGALERVAGR